MKNISCFMFITFLIMTLCNVSCRSGNDEHGAHLPEGEYYTCPMHPTVRSDRPGTCPICNMTLVKVSSVTKDTASNTIQIVKEQHELANITFDTVKFLPLGKGINLSGTTTFNEQKSSAITARAKGRIIQLVKRNPGEKIKKGDLLYTLYSEELLTMEKEYVIALEQQEQFKNENTVNSLVNASKQRMILSGISASVISDLEKNRKTHNAVPFYSDAAGTIIDIPVKEGAYVETGTMIYSINETSSLWVDAELYSSEVGQIRNQSATAEINGRTYKLRSELVSPTFSENTTINTIRYRIEDPAGDLKPGMRAYIRLADKADSTLAVPKRSILLGKMPMVWVKKSEDLFENRMVETGIESGEFVEIKSGLKEGEIIVGTGAYLVNSEFILKKGAKVQHQH